MTKTKSSHLAWEEKYAALTAAAQEIIDREVSDRDKKTAHLKELRLAQEAKMTEDGQNHDKPIGSAAKRPRVQRAKTQR
ncbi:hypothetical protein FZC33_08290 [Labrys sp. KNU-23]|uniref:hypothetical protein n=1 Tax=Labrys sp. KNU-23 TaxID=2789216 RepID=UPI0011EF32BC|nr:hypothetical protein [Labrys sp. KNU-23]QEN86172.1 hypothetical protein FZC33_08290 [Labrys sp. KNU-23]